MIKKWLSYRERELLGQALKPDDARNSRKKCCQFVSLFYD